MASPALSSAHGELLADRVDIILPENVTHFKPCPVMAWTLRTSGFSIPVVLILLTPPFRLDRFASESQSNPTAA